MSAKSITLLQIEDNSDDLIFTERALSRIGAAVDLHVAWDGEEVKEGLSKNKVVRMSYPTPDVILLDLDLPRMNGFEVLSWIKSQSHLQMIPVFVFTGSIRSEDVQKALSLGASCTYQKPSHPQAWETILTDVLAKASPSPRPNP